MNTHRIVLGVALTLATTALLQASSVIRLSTAEHVSQAVAVCRGTVVEVTSFRGADGGIHTRTLLRVDEALKGRFPSVVKLVHRGGEVAGEGEHDGFTPRFVIGEERLLFLGRQADGTLFALNGVASARRLERSTASANALSTAVTPGFVAADEALLAEIRRLVLNPEAGTDLTSQGASPQGKFPDPPVNVAVATNLLPVGGISCRFLAQDRGESVKYLVDATARPAGLTLEQCMTAVTNAFKAWSLVTSSRFEFAGFEAFGRAPRLVATNDARIRIALHDLYGDISGADTLGVGGRGYTTSSLFPSGGLGGNVKGNEFNPTTRGYLVLKHTHPVMQTAQTFEEVVCHEIGHVLSMAHSSEVQTEPDLVKREAMMYFLVHADGRGATLGSYDPPVIQQMYPISNTPPYAYDRILYAVTASTAINVAGVNSVGVGGDLQPDPLSLSIVSEAGFLGSFSVAGNLVKYTADFPYDEVRLPPTGVDLYDYAYARISDGVNGSPYAEIRVLSLELDSFPPTRDGMPNEWMIQYFGSADPAAGANRRASDDFDGDGMTNLQEFLADTNPADKNSCLKISAMSPTSIQWQARPYHVYEVQGSTVISNFSRVLTAITPTTTTGSAGGFTNGIGPKQFFRIQRVP